MHLSANFTSKDISRKRIPIFNMTVDEEEIFATYNEFRSDTFTVPTRSMIEAGFMNATYGDSVYCEDQATLNLEARMCEITGKEAALFAHRVLYQTKLV